MRGSRVSAGWVGCNRLWSKGNYNTSTGACAAACAAAACAAAACAAAANGMTLLPEKSST